MADGTEKPIETVAVGEAVLTYNLDNHRLEPQPVLQVHTTIHTGKGDDYTVRLYFANGTVNHNTLPHPYYVEGKGWASYRPNADPIDGKLVAQLAIGDTVYCFVHGEVVHTKLIRIEEIFTEVVTYNLMNVANNHNFFANKILGASGFMVGNL